MTKAWITWTVMLVVVIVAGFVLYPIAEEQGDVVYKGREVFTTEEEYSQFKWAIANSDAKILEIEVLSSTPPIIVDYKFLVDYGNQFGYGDRDVTFVSYFATWYRVLCGLFLGLFFVSGIYMYIYGYGE